MAKQTAEHKALCKEVETRIAAIGNNASKLSAYHWELRLQFRNNLGLPAATVNSGYKFGEVAKPELLDNAIAAYIQFKHLSETLNMYRPIVAKMERNLRNSDRASKFAALQREAAKQAQETPQDGEEA